LQSQDYNNHNDLRFLVKTDGEIFSLSPATLFDDFLLRLFLSFQRVVFVMPSRSFLSIYMWNLI